MATANTVAESQSRRKATPSYQAAGILVPSWVTRIAARVVEEDAGLPDALAKVRGAMCDLGVMIARRFGWSENLYDRLSSRPTLLRNPNLR